MLCISFLTGKAFIFAFFNPKRFVMKRKEEAPVKGADTVKEWMEAHPQEYAQFAAKMKTEGIGGVPNLGEDAFRLSRISSRRWNGWLPPGGLMFPPCWNTDVVGLCRKLFEGKE